MTTPKHRRDQFDVPLIDPALLEEIHLLAALMAAASGSEEHLGAREIDRALGVRVPRQPKASE